MKKYIHIFLIFALALTSLSCNREDDLEDIFVGKTWYMVNYAKNGSSKTGNFFNYDDKGYQINFQANSFRGELTPGITFSGNWHADGKNRTITFTITNGASTSGDFDPYIYPIIKNARYYTGDNNQIKIYQDSKNYISFNSVRSSSPNNN